MMAYQMGFGASYEAVTETDYHRLLGEPTLGGLLIVADHASNRVPDGIDLGIPDDLLNLHIGVDIGVAGISERMIKPGTAAWLGNVSRLVCDYNRAVDAPGLMPLMSDGHLIPGNDVPSELRQTRVDRFFKPYHTGLKALLKAKRPSLILSLHSFTPALETSDQSRPWEIGILYNQDERAARIALPWLSEQGFVVGDQEPYSGKILNDSMNVHAEASGIPYLSVEVRQDLIGDASGQDKWAKCLNLLCEHIIQSL